MSFLYLMQIFKLTSGNIIRAKNGKEAIEKATSSSQLDLILMDLQLPDIPGTKVIGTIHKKNPDIPIIAQTAARSPEEHEKAYKAGCSDILVKPFNMDALLEKINEYIL